MKITVLPFEDNGIKVYCLNSKNYLSFFNTLRKLFKIIKYVKPDYIQSWLYLSDLFVSILSFVNKKIPVIWTIHHASLTFENDGLFTKYIVFLLAKLSKFIPNYVIYCSEYSYNVHKQIGYKEKKSEVIKNGIDIEKFKPEIKKSFLYRKSKSIPIETKVGQLRIPVNQGLVLAILQNPIGENFQHQRMIAHGG